MRTLAAPRCIVQGIELVTAHFGLDRARMHERIARKTRHLRGWHSLLAGGKAAP